jgi:hypothetical protein
MRYALLACLLFIGGGLGANGPDTPPVTPQAVTPQATCEWTEAFSGRFYLSPPSAWINEFKREAKRTGENQKPLKYEEAHWFVYLETIDGHQDQCAKKPKDRPKGAPTCVSDRVGKSDVLTATRKQVLKVLVDQLLLTEEKGLSAAFPSELYSPELWWRMVKKSIEVRGLSSEAFCRMKIVVHAKYRKNSQPGDLRWWEVTTVTLPEGMGECKAGAPSTCAP